MISYAEERVLAKQGPSPSATPTILLSYPPHLLTDDKKKKKKKKERGKKRGAWDDGDGRQPGDDTKDRVSRIYRMIGCDEFSDLMIILKSWSIYDKV